MEHDELCVIRSDLFLDMALPNEKCHHQKSPGLFRLFIFMAYFCFNPKRYEKMFTGWLGSLYIPSLIFLRMQKYYSTRILQKSSTVLIANLNSTKNFFSPSVQATTVRSCVSKVWRSKGRGERPPFTASVESAPIKGIVHIICLQVHLQQLKYRKNLIKTNYTNVQ